MTYRASVPVRYPDQMLTDGQIRLRPWSFDDLDAIREAGTDLSIPAGTTVPSRWSVEAGRDFIRRQLRRAETGEGISLAMHAIELDRAVGLISMMLRPQPRVIGLGYWVVPSARRNGFARRAVTLAGDWAIGPGGFARIEAWVEPHNQPSQSLLLATGFELEGRLRSFLAFGDSRSDALVYSRITTTAHPRSSGKGRHPRHDHRRCSEVSPNAG